MNNSKKQITPNDLCGSNKINDRTVKGLLVFFMFYFSLCFSVFFFFLSFSQSFSKFLNLSLIFVCTFIFLSFFSLLLGFLLFLSIFFNFPGFFYVFLYYLDFLIFRVCLEVSACRRITESMQIFVSARYDFCLVWVTVLRRSGAFQKTSVPPRACKY